MLSRVADALYWMGRYVERAEHAARVLIVARDIELDLAHLDAEAANFHLGSVRSALGITAQHTEIERMVFDASEPATITSSVDRARQNARQVREVTSSTMWEQINALYWRLQEAERGEHADLFQSLVSVTDGCLLWNALTDSTMVHAEGWLFIKLGQFVERADRVSRLLMARVRDSALASQLGTDTDNLLWLSVLRSCSALEAYRAVNPTRVSAKRVLEFMVFERYFPRAVRFSVDRAASFANEVTAITRRGAEVERRFGRLAAELDYADLEEISTRGTDNYLSDVLHGLGEASMAVQRQFFLH